MSKDDARLIVWQLVLEAPLTIFAYRRDGLPLRCRTFANNGGSRGKQCEDRHRAS